MYYIQQNLFSQLKFNVKPFLKWAGGKTQLIDKFILYLPRELKDGKINRYIEPFIGSGAFFFYLVQRFDFKETVIIDLNKDLIDTYISIKNNVEEVIKELKLLTEKFYRLKTDEQKKFYYEVRDSFNENRKTNYPIFKKSAQLIFLNKTCYNGLYRVNSEGEFNVPFGRYSNPKIFNEVNLRNISKILQATLIIHGDFTKCSEYIDRNTFVYFDPPYRPLNNTSNFTSYFNGGFDDNDQRRLADLFNHLDTLGAKLMLSNSDPKNVDPDDEFFESLYNKPHYTILRIDAKRLINSNANKRGKISELLITNYRI